MNTKLLKFIGVFVVGVGLGATATTIYLKNKYEEIVQEEIESIRETLAPHLSSRRETTAVRATELEEDEIDQETKKDSKILNIERKRHNRIARRYNTTSDEEQEASDLEHEKMSHDANQVNSDHPYVITLEQFSEEMVNFDKLTIYYYEDDGTLADENEEIISDETYIVGDEALIMFGEGSDDPEIVYVRNEKLMSDYEVIRLSKSYKDEVLGRGK